MMNWFPTNSTSNGNLKGTQKQLIMHKRFFNAFLESMRLQNVIGRRLLIAILIFSSIITLAGTSFQLYQEYDGDIQFLNQQIENVRKTQLDSLAKAYWDLEVDQVNLQLEGIIQQPFVEYVEIIDPLEGLEDYTGFKFTKGLITSKKTISFSYPLVYHHKKVQKTIGTLAIFASHEPIMENLK